MLLELELVKVSKAIATAKTADGREVVFGYRKHAHILSQLIDKQPGYKFTQDVETSGAEYGSNLYLTYNMDIAKTYFEVEMMNKRRTVIDRQIAALDSKI